MILRGELVTLEPLDVDKHAQGYFEVSLDENIHKWVGNTVPTNVVEIVNLLNLYQEYFVNWVIISNETRKVIGIMRLGKPSKENDLLISGESQRLHSSFWRKGHMKEAKKLFYEYVFNVLEIDVLYADVWEGNINSIKSLEASGYKLIEERIDKFQKTGENKTKYIFSFTKDNYQMMKKASLS